MQGRLLGAERVVAELPEVAQRLVRREVVELHPSLQLLVGELRIEAVLLLFFNIDIAVAGVDDLFRAVEVDAGCIGENHLVALSGHQTAADADRHIEDLTVLSRQRRVARQVEAIGVRLGGVGFHGQRMACGTLCLHGIGRDGREALREFQHDGDTVDILGVLQEDRIEHRLPEHAVGRHAIEAEVLVGGLSRLVGVAGIVFVAVVGHERNVVVGNGHRVNAAGADDDAVDGPVLERIPLVVVCAEGLRRPFGILVAACHVEISACSWVGHQVDPTVEHRLAGLTGTAWRIREVGHKVVGVDTFQHDIVEGSARRDNLAVECPVRKREVGSRIGLHPDGVAHLIAVAACDVEAAASRWVGRQIEIRKDRLGRNIRLGRLRRTGRCIVVVGNERRVAVGHRVVEVGGGGYDRAIFFPRDEREVGSCIGAKTDGGTRILGGRRVQVEASSPWRIGLKRQRVLPNRCSRLRRVRRIVLPPHVGTRYECQREENILETSHSCSFFKWTS